MQPLSQTQRELLGSLLNVIIQKMKYNEETEWGADDDEPEEEVLFAELRKVRISKRKRKRYYEWRSIADNTVYLCDIRIFACLLIMLPLSTKTCMSATCILSLWKLSTGLNLVPISTGVKWNSACMSCIHMAKLFPRPQCSL